MNELNEELGIPLVLQGHLTIVIDNRIILQGYNGTIPGFKNCSEVFYEINMIDLENRKTHSVWSKAFELHAEMNIICYAGKIGIALKDTIIYCTHEPCNDCLKHLIQAGVTKVYYVHKYKHGAILGDREKLLEFIELYKIKLNLYEKAK